MASGSAEWAHISAHLRRATRGVVFLALAEGQSRPGHRRQRHREDAVGEDRPRKVAVAGPVLILERVLGTHVVVVAGDGFGDGGCLELSMLTSIDSLWLRFTRNTALELVSASAVATASTREASPWTFVAKVPTSIRGRGLR